MQDMNYQQIRKSGFFRSNSEIMRFLILEYLAESDTSMGSWVLTNKLKEQGLKTSLATVGRALKASDGDGYTSLENNEGRMITEKGREYVRKNQNEIRRFYLNNRLMNSVKIDSSKQLEDIITVRILLETDSVRRAVLNLTEEAVGRMKRILTEVDAHPEDLSLVTRLNAQFHKEIAAVADNRFVMTIMDILLDEQWNIENSFDVQPKYHNYENAQDHWRILRSMEERDPDKAVRHMKRHLEKLRDDALRGIQFSDEEEERNG